MNNLWVIGDSTLSEFNDEYFYNRYGYATALQPYFDDNIKVRNIALSGRSSKSFLKEPEYKELMSNIKEGDYLLIGFGHNDEKTEEERYTTGSSDLDDKRSLAYCLYNYYIAPANTLGCRTILATPIVRRSPDGVWNNSNMHITEDIKGYPGGNYPDAVIELGKKLNIPVIDMTAITRKLYDEMGPDETLFLHAWTSNRDISVDNTHTNSWGARVNAYKVASSIKTNPLLVDLSKHIVNLEQDSPLPAKDKCLLVNKNYKPVVFDPNLEDSKLWKDYKGFKGTVFGDIGVNVTHEHFAIEEDKDGNLHMAVSYNHGKISDTSDGIVMCYKKIPADKPFVLKAKMRINDYCSHDQVTFGLMVRDDCYVDQITADVLGDFVAAGPLKLTKGSEAWNCFARKSGVLTKGGTVTREYKIGDEVELKLTSTSDGFAATLGDEETITGGFDFKLTSIDPENVYVGMFVSRNADVTFSRISLEY